MTSSFFGALPALPCIVNGCGSVCLSGIPKRSRQPAYPEGGTLVSPEGRLEESVSPLTDSRLNPPFPERSGCLEAVGSRPHGGGGGPSYPQLCCRREANQLARSEAIGPHAIHLHGHTGKQRTRIPQVLQFGPSVHALCGQLRRELPPVSSGGIN